LLARHNVLFGAVLAVVLALSSAQGATKPNVLFIMTDQQRFDAMTRAQEFLEAYEGKVHVRTPNLDRLSRQGAYFVNAYTQCPVCGPARTILRTGCTLERTGVQTNALADEEPVVMTDVFKDKQRALDSLDQVLVEDHGYVSEYYGKWHIPQRFFYTRDGSEQTIHFNNFNYRTNQPTFANSGGWGNKLKGFLRVFEDAGQVNKTFGDGQQEDTYTRFPYTPISLDSRFGMATRTDLYDRNRFDDFGQSQNSVKGLYSLPAQFSSSYFNHDVAMKSLDRLAMDKTQPWILTVSYHHPHPPMMAIDKYLDYYKRNSNQIYVPSTLQDRPDDSGYYRTAEINYLTEQGYIDETNVQEWTAVYYALVEEIDDYIGEMLDRLDQHGLTNDTLVLFTSDHGEMLGAHHGLRGKAKFFEEATRVPLMFKFPGRIPDGKVVFEPVTLLDVFSTILDYAGAGASDDSDGTSLRRFIEDDAYNAEFDESFVVFEWDYRQPTGANSLERDLDSEPAFAARHRSGWKLMMHKQSDSDKIDMLYHVPTDPGEHTNFVGRRSAFTTNTTVFGKAEHMRILLVEWMIRMDGENNEQYYSSPQSNAGQGRGDIVEISLRQPWERLPIWVSDADLLFAEASWNGTHYVRNEYLYIGTRTPGTLTIDSIVSTGSSGFSFETELVVYNANRPTSTGVLQSTPTPAPTTDPNQVLEPGSNATIESLERAAVEIPVVTGVQLGQFDYLRIKVMYVSESESQPQDVTQTLEIQHDDPTTSTIFVDIEFEAELPCGTEGADACPTESPSQVPSSAPSPFPTAQASPTAQPTLSPSMAPTAEPTATPTSSPTASAGTLGWSGVDLVLSLVAMLGFVALL